MNMTENEWTVWQGAFQSVMDAMGAGGTRDEKSPHGNALANDPSGSVDKAVSAANKALDGFRKIPARDDTVSGDE